MSWPSCARPAANTSVAAPSSWPLWSVPPPPKIRTIRDDPQFLPPLNLSIPATYDSPVPLRPIFQNFKPKLTMRRPPLPMSMTHQWTSDCCPLSPGERVRVRDRPVLRTLCWPLSNRRSMNHNPQSSPPLLLPSCLWMSLPKATTPSSAPSSSVHTNAARPSSSKPSSKRPPTARDWLPPTLSLGNPRQLFPQIERPESCISCRGVGTDGKIVQKLPRRGNLVMTNGRIDCSLQRKAWARCVAGGFYFDGTGITLDKAFPQFISI